MKKILRIISQRLVIVSLLILFQIALIVVMMLQFRQYFLYFNTVCTALSLVVVLVIVNRNTNPAYKIAWIIPILCLPVFGWLLYIFFAGNQMTHRAKRKMQQIEHKQREMLPDREMVIAEIDHYSEDAARQSRYIQDNAYCPPYARTESLFLPGGEAQFSRMIEDLNKAEHFIFMEYFIIQEGLMWNTLLDILVRKAREGVDVRLIYDDMGCIMTLPYRYYKTMEEAGIRCCVFNPFIPVVSGRMNNRDHRKICVIDGDIGYTGGINLADEYINEYERFGYWKDAGIRLYGEGVWNLTVMFLTMWEYICGTTEDYTQFQPGQYHPLPEVADGYVQPYCDSPLDGEYVGETVYLNMIHRARRYVYITTPYLVLDNEMTTALCMAAKSDVDVRIMTPHIPDKWYVHAVSRANYSALAESGVKIYEFTPGFVHAKTVVVDDEYATVGTINFDYRSLYLHYECGVWLFRTESIWAIKRDYLNTLSSCQLVTAEDCRKVSLPRRLVRSVLRIFAPLM